LQVEEITGDIFRVNEYIPGASGVFSIYFIRGGGNALIEPGPAALVPVIREAAASLDITGFRYIIPTHIHMDHAGGTGGLIKMFPEATAVFNAQGARHAIDPSRLIRSTRMAFGDDFEDTYGTIEPVPEQRAGIVRDGDRLRLGDRELEIIDTPGHAPHHIAIFDASRGELFCGEALGLIYRTGAPPLPSAAPPSFDLDACIRSMEKLGELPLKLLMYSHGGISREPEKSVENAIENVRAFGEVILKARKILDTEEAVLRTVADFIRERFGVEMHEYDLASNVNGFTGYFRKQGLI
jgi:glyoxylase-like metal-dependent hydrolase (beta-lactamase superfamily II)